MTKVIAQGTAFTYQGVLSAASAFDTHTAANGLFDFQFSVFDAASAGNQAGTTQAANMLAVSNGLFTATLDFGAGVFNGANRWLAIAVRTNGAGGFTTLSPRQPLTPAPYVIYAASAGAAATVADGVTNQFSLISTQAAQTVLATPNYTVAFTNPTFYTKGWKLTVTNDASTNMVFDISPTDGLTTGVNLQQVSSSFAANGDYYQKIMTFVHGGYPPNTLGSELQESCFGNIARSPGYQRSGIAHDQIGIGGANHDGGASGGTYNYWGYAQACPSVANVPGYSYAHTWRCRTGGGRNEDTFPGIIGRSWTNAGRYELTFMRDLYVTVGALGDTWAIQTIIPGGSLYTYTNNTKYGWELRGGLVQDFSSASPAGGTMALDFGTTYAKEIYLLTNALTFYTTNTQATATNYEAREFLLRAITTVAATWPTNWLVVSNGVAGPMPTNLNAGTFLQLTLKNFGNQTVANYFIGVDASALDADAQTYFTRASITNATFKFAVSQYITALKAASIWTNFGTLHITPTEAGYLKDVITSSYDWTLTGTVYVTNGVGFAAGNAAYLDTGYNPNTAVSWSTNSSFVAAYGGTVAASGLLLGADIGGTRYVSFNASGANMVMTGLNNSDPQTIGASSDFSGLMMMNRTASTTQTSYIRSSSAASSVAAVGPPTVNIYIGARNNGGSPANYFTGNTRFFTAGRGLNAAGLTAFQAAVAQLKTTLGWP